MSDIAFEILKVIVMLAALLVTRYLVPWIKSQISAKEMEEIRAWVNDAVLMAQQVHDTKPGAERKAIVVDLLRNMLIEKNIALSIEQLDMLIEAAVKTMKMQEAK